MERERSFKPRTELPKEDELSSVRSAAGVLSSLPSSQTVKTFRDDSHLLRVSEGQGVELTFDVPWCDLEKFQAKPHSSRNLIASTIRTGAEVTMRQLDKEARKEFDIAKSAEIQSWLRYEAVTASADIMKRWMLRYKESGHAKGTVSDRGTNCITPWNKFVFHGNRSQSVLTVPELRTRL